MAKRPATRTGGAILGGYGTPNREIAPPVLGGGLNSQQQKAIKQAVMSQSRSGIARGPAPRGRNRGSRFE